MKRDLDLVRAILLRVEDHDSQEPIQPPLDIDGYDAETVAGHVRLLLEASYLEGHIDVTVRAPNEPTWFMIERVTWDGHDYLDAVRADTVWSKVKTMAREKGVTLTVELAKAAAIAYAKAHLLGRSQV